MARTTTKARSRVSTKSKLSIKHKIVVSFMLASALTLGLGFAGVFVKALESKQLPVPIVRPTPGASPLIVNNIYDAELNQRLIFDGSVDWGETSAAFYRSTYELGTFHFGFGYYNAGEAVPPGTEGALRMEITNGYFNSQDTIVLPSRIMRIYNSTTTAGHSLCIPETELTQEDMELYGGVSYYYDVNGTPYYDNLLIRKAMAEDCDDMLARSMDIEQIDNAMVNLRAFNVYQDTSSAEVFIDMAHDFDDPEDFGSLNLMNNYYSGGLVYPNNIVSPFRILLSAGGVFPYDFPARILHINNSAGGEYNLCVPATRIEAQDYPNGHMSEIVSYFYDNNGTPYHDSLLSQRAIPEDCNTILARSLDVREIFDAGINKVVRSTNDFYEIQVNFLTDFGGFSSELGSLNVVRNTYYASPFDANDINSPLAIGISGTTYYGDTFPSRIIHIVTSSSTESGYDLCVPTTQVLEGEDGAKYFYDNNGTPYFDSLLMRRALPRNCNEILANSLDVRDVLDAEVDRIVEGDFYPGALFPIDYSEWDGFGSLSLSNNEYYYNLYSDRNDLKAPFMVEISHDAPGAPSTTPSIPYRNITIFTNNASSSHSLCVPPTQWGEEDWYSKTYFYDIYGKPYRDSLLLERVACPPKPIYIDEIPYEVMIR